MLVSIVWMLAAREALLVRKSNGSERRAVICDIAR